MYSVVIRCMSRVNKVVDARAAQSKFGWAARTSLAFIDAYRCTKYKVYFKAIYNQSISYNFDIR